MSNKLYNKLKFIPIILIIISVLVIGINLVKPNENKFSFVKNFIADEEVKNESYDSFFNDVMYDLNKISYKELLEIPGIGESLAKEIINFRNDASKFNHLNELLLIKGINEDKFKSLVRYLYVISER